jgi:hypothetical protein
VNDNRQVEHHGSAYNNVKFFIVGVIGIRFVDSIVVENDSSGFSKAHAMIQNIESSLRAVPLES